MTESPSSQQSRERSPQAGGSLSDLRKLRRAKDGRVLGGVCAGLGRQLRIDPVVLRVLLAVMVFFGGSGVLVYGAAWLLIAEEGSDVSVLERHLGRRPNGAPDKAVVIGGVVLLLLIVASVPWWGWGSSWHPAALLVMAGIGLYLLLRRQHGEDGSGHVSSHPGQGGPPAGFESWLDEQRRTGPDTPPAGPGPGQAGPGLAGPGHAAPPAGTPRPPAGPQFSGPHGDHPPGGPAPGGRPSMGPVTGPAPGAPAPGGPGGHPPLGGTPGGRPSPGGPQGGATEGGTPPSAGLPGDDQDQARPSAEGEGSAEVRTDPFSQPRPDVGGSTSHTTRPLLGSGVRPLTVRVTGSWRDARPQPPEFWNQPDPLGLEDDGGPNVPPPAGPALYVPPRPAPRQPRSKLFWVTSAFALIALGVLASVDISSDIEPAAYLATALGVVGLGLVAGAWVGRSPGLVVTGVLLAVALLPTTVGERLMIEGSGSRTERVTSVSEIASSYQHGAGDLTVDLSRVTFTEADSVSTSISSGAGDIDVLVPPGVDVTVTAETGFGDADVFGERSDRPGDRVRVTNEGRDGPGGGRLDIKIELGAGDVEVRRG